MADIYEQHKAAFKDVAAYVVTDSSGERVATIAFKYPRDGAGRLYAYVHWIGIEMARGFAAGGGYDKGSAACSASAAKLYKAMPLGTKDGDPLWAFYSALAKDDGHRWHDRLRGAGFQVWQAV